MNMPGFNADGSLYKTSECYDSLSQNQSALPANLSPNVQMAMFPEGDGPPSTYTKCGSCGSTGWKWCQKIDFGEPIGEKFRKECRFCGPCAPTVLSGGKFVQNCVSGGQNLPPKPCEVCKTISTPWYVPDDLRICCNGVNFATDCSFTFV
jgi:hypothetical protein